MPKEIVLLTGRERTTRIVSSAILGTGWSLIEVSNVVDALRKCSKAVPALLVIDWLLPDEAGLEACRRLRQLERFAHLPIVLLVDSNSAVDKQRAIAAGATSILITPILGRELRVRLGELLDRIRLPLEPTEPIRIGDIEIDVAASLARRRGRILSLGPSEFRLLELMARSPAHLATREQIVEHLWGKDTSVKVATMNIYIVRLRKALMTVRRTDPIRTVRGVGYQLVGR